MDTPALCSHFPPFGNNSDWPVAFLADLGEIVWTLDDDQQSEWSVDSIVFLMRINVN